MYIQYSVLKDWSWAHYQGLISTSSSILKTAISPDFSQIFSISYVTFLVLCEHVKCQASVSLSSGVQGAGPQSFTIASTLSDLPRRQLVDLTFRSDRGLTFWWGIQAVLMSRQQCFSADLASPCHPSLGAVFIQDIPSSSTERQALGKPWLAVFFLKKNGQDNWDYIRQVAQPKFY